MDFPKVTIELRNVQEALYDGISIAHVSSIFEAFRRQRFGWWETLSRAFRDVLRNECHLGGRVAIPENLVPRSGFHWRGLVAFAIDFVVLAAGAVVYSVSTR